MSFKDIPRTDVLFRLIFPDLSLKDLFQVGATSRSENECVDEYLATIKEIDLSSQKFQNLPRFTFMRLTRACLNLKKVNISKCLLIDDHVLSGLFFNNPGIKDLNISECFDLCGSCIYSLTANCLGLKSLNVKGCRWLKDFHMETIASELKELEEINFSACDNLDISHFQLLFENDSKLKKIRMDNVSNVDDMTIFMMATTCPLLENLNVRDCPLVSHLGMRSLMRFCGSLKTLEISCINNILLEQSLIHVRKRGVAVNTLE